MEVKSKGCSMGDWGRTVLIPVHDVIHRWSEYFKYGISVAYSEQETIITCFRMSEVGGRRPMEQRRREGKLQMR